MSYEKYAKIRDSKGLSDYKIAQMSGVSRQTLYDWKAGKYVPKQKKLKSLADILGVSVSDLMEGSEYEYDFETHTWYEGPEPENEKVGTLSEQEEYLVLQYRDLSEKKKDALLTYLEFLLQTEMGE